MLSHVWWGWIFLVNVPVALLGLVAVLALVPESRSAKRPGIDLVGVVLSCAGLVALMYGVVKAGDDGWGSASAIGPVAAGLACLPCSCSGSAGSPPNRTESRSSTSRSSARAASRGGCF